MTHKATDDGAVTIKGEKYLSVERAAEYIGRKRASMFNYIKRYNLETHKLPLHGKRIFVKQSDLDRLKAGDIDPKASEAAA